MIKMQMATHAQHWGGSLVEEVAMVQQGLSSGSTVSNPDPGEAGVGSA